MAAKPENREALWRVTLPNGSVRATVLALLTDGSVPAQKTWDEMDGQIVKKIRNRFLVLMQVAQLWTVQRELATNMGGEVWYVLLHDPRWRVFMFADAGTFHITEMLKNPSNRQISEAVQRATEYRKRFIRFVIPPEGTP